MKKTLLGALVIIMTALVSQTAQAQNHNGLPENAKNYISRHFENSTINHYQKDSEILDTEYNVYITHNGVSYHLEFDKKGNVKDVHSADEKTALPASVIPVKIAQDVKKRFPNAKIVDWSIERKIQTVELDIDVELKYNSKGDFVRIDD